MKRYTFATILAGVVLAMSCTSSFDDINTNKNALSNLGAAELPFLFSKAQQIATHYVWTYQVAQNLFADQYAQYFACTATYFPSDRLVIRQDWVGSAFNPIYTDVLPQLQTLFENNDPSSAEYAIADIWWVYSFHRVTDYWGPIPYSKAGIPGSTVDYDPQDEIYSDFFTRLDNAISVLQTKTGTNAYGSFDLIYEGDVDNWIRFANTLKLRLALRISKVEPALAKTHGESAVADGVMTTSPAHDALIERSLTGADYNGLSVMSDWGEFRMSAAMESVLKGYDDPRMGIYFQPAKNNGEFNGLRNGLASSDLTLTINKADENSHVGERWTSVNIALDGRPDHNATPQNVMCSAEAWFLRAEGALLGWNMGTTAQAAYEAGIAASMNQWGITDAGAINAYKTSLNTPVAPQDFLNSPPMTDIPVAYDAGDATVALEQVMTQKWLALYPEGMEAWADYRRSKVLKLYPVAVSENSDITNTTTQWLRRIPFLTSEKQNNGPAVEAAVSLLGPGGDKVTTPLWWDKN